MTVAVMGRVVSMGTGLFRITPGALALGLMENTMTKNEKIESLKELISEAKFQLTLPTFLQVSYSHEETNQTIKDATRQLNKLAQE